MSDPSAGPVRLAVDRNGERYTPSAAGVDTILTPGIIADLRRYGLLPLTRVETPADGRPPLELDLPGMWEDADLTGGAADSGMLRCDDCQRWASRLHPIPTNPPTGGIAREVCAACKEHAR